MKIEQKALLSQRKAMAKTDGKKGGRKVERKKTIVTTAKARKHDHHQVSSSWSFVINIIISISIRKIIF